MKLHYYSTTIKYLYYILFFTVPFVVFPFNSELFEFNKMLFIYVITTLILGVWLLRSLQEKKIIFKRTPLDIPIGIFFLSQVLSTLFSIDQHTSIFGYYGRFNGGLLSTAVYIFLYYGFVSNIDEYKNEVIKKLFEISVLTSLLVVLWGIPGRFNRDLSCLLFTSKFNNSCWTAQFKPAERMFSTLGQPNWFGAYLAITFFLSIFLLLVSHKKKVLYAVGIGTLFSYMGILFSRSRSALGSLAPGLLLLGLYFIFLQIKKNQWLSVQKRNIILALCGVGILLTFIIQTGVPQVDSYLSFSFLRHKSVQPVPVAAPPVQQSLEYVGGITESFDIRKIVWKGAWELGNQYPLFGTGVETFGYAYYLVRPQAHNLTSEWDYLYNKAHNEYLNILATTGWLGLGTFAILTVAIWILLIKKMVKERKNHESVLFYLTLAAVQISIFITNFFGFSITVVNVYWYASLGFLVLYNTPETPSLHKNNNKISLPQVGMVILLVLWLLNSIGNYWFADYKYAQSEIAIKSNDSATAVNLLQEAMTLRNEHVYQDKLSYALAQYAFMASYQKEKVKSQDLINVAEKLNLKSLQESPQNVLYWKTRVKNQFIFYQMSFDRKYLFTGLAALDEAYKLAPTDPKIPYFSATYYSLLYDDEKNKGQKEIYQEQSMRAIDRAIALKSDYGDAYYLKIQLLRKYGDRAEARKLLEWYIPRYAPSDPAVQKELKDLSP